MNAHYVLFLLFDVQKNKSTVGVRYNVDKDNVIII